MKQSKFLSAAKKEEDSGPVLRTSGCLNIKRGCL